MTDFLIKFAFQNWNEKYDWWHPNTVPLDFIINGKQCLPATHDYHWFEHNNFSVIADFTSINLFNFPARKSDYLCNYKNVRYFRLDDVTNTKYIFPIIIHGINYFTNHKDIGFKFVSTQVLTDVKNGKAKIVIMFPLEGVCGQKILSQDSEFEILNNWCLEHNLNKDQVYFIHGNFKVSKEIESYHFTYIPVHAFHCWLTTELDDILEYDPVDNKNLFLSYNRRCDYHRLLLICHLIKNNILERGLVSFSGKANYVNGKSMTELMNTFLDLVESANKLDKLLPLELDIPLEFNNPVNEIVQKHHSRTFLNIITETAFRPGTIFYSEKTWKPILAGQPFMYVGTQGQLAELKRQGFQSFDRWINEDYDDEPEIDNRIKMVVNELVRLSKLSVDQLIEIRKEMKLILQHNQSLYLHQRNNIYKNQTEEYLYLEIKKIWDSF